MSVKQSSESEIRYSKVKNLENEARVVGNYYRDQIRSYGIDCRYYKSKIPFEEYKGVIDENVLLRHAYGYDDKPDYSLSTEMITYMEVEQDMFNLQKNGYIPNPDVNFYFDSGDFAFAMACKCGRYKEYKVDETEIVCEVPEYSESTKDSFPYILGLGYKEYFKAGSLKGRFQVNIDSYELNKEQEVICDPYEHGLMVVKEAVNPDLYKSFARRLENTDYLNILLKLKFKVVEADGRFILHGRLSGSVLFYDIIQIGKYADKIHPEVGDVVTIDFPNEKSREQYEITEAFDKNLASDGINMFLRKYIWKCKARRRIPSHEDFPEENEANDRIQEAKEFEGVARDAVHDQIKKYPENEDAVYGGYDNDYVEYDKDMPSKKKARKYSFIEAGTAEVISTFRCGSSLVTDGYELYFKRKDGDAVKLTAVEDLLTVPDNLVDEGLKFLKATSEAVYFVNFDNKVCRLAIDELASKGALSLCLDSLIHSTLDNGNSIVNEDCDFFKFPGCKTVLWATETDLYARLESNGRLYRLT